jgi:hypothetical protein
MLLDPPNWSLRDAERYNRWAEKSLRDEMTRSAKVGIWEVRHLQHTAQRVSAPTEVLLRYAYAEWRGSVPARKVSEELKPVFTYFHPARGVGSRVALAPPTSFSANELRQAQIWVRMMIAQLLLAYYPNGTSRGWQPPEDEGAHRFLPLPKINRAVFTVARVGLFAVGPEITGDRGMLSPPWMRLVIPASAVLVDAQPWLRFCALCGRVFFKVKRKRLCAPDHAKVFFARQARENGSRRASGPRRGRKRTEYEEQVIAQHQTWLHALP